jgi:CelD/BcsL family acetyltransferase involved in cellulose biosynthesis
MWGFASPLVGPDAGSVLRDAAEELGRPHLLLSGVGRERAEALARTLRGHYRLRAVDTTMRFVASLEGGVEGFLARRSRSMRRNLRAAVRRVEAEGVRFEHASPNAEALPALYERILAVEARSWKGVEGVGVDSGSMEAFYRGMLPRLAERGALRVAIARHGGEDVGYLTGGVIDGHFRGLQVSYDQRFERAGLGNCLQLEMIRALVTQGVERYDLGTQSAYKQRWAEEGPTTLHVHAQPLATPSNSPA